MIYINPYLSGRINTIIGGVAASINTKAALAFTLGVSESIISNFRIVGDDIHFLMNSNYDIKVSAFDGNLSIKSFIDLEGKCLLSDLRYYIFRGCSNLLDVFLPATLNVPAFTFYQCPLSTRLRIDSAVSIYESGLSFTNFPNQLPETISYLGPSALYSINAGSVLNLPLITSLPVSTTPIRDSSTLQEIYLDNCTNIFARANAFRNLTALNILSIKKLKTFNDASQSTTLNCFAGLKLGCEIRTNITMATASGGNAHFLFVWAKNNRSAIVKFYDDNGDYVSTL